MKLVNEKYEGSLERFLLATISSAEANDVSEKQKSNYPNASAKKIGINKWKRVK
jgi:hypothetical protein